MNQCLEIDPRQQDLFLDWPTVDEICPRVLAGEWVADCPPPDANGVDLSLAAPSVPDQGVGIHLHVQDVARYPSYFTVREEYWDYSRFLNGCLDAPEVIPAGGACS